MKTSQSTLKQFKEKKIDFLLLSIQFIPMCVHGMWIVIVELTVTVRGYVQLYTDSDSEGLCATVHWQWRCETDSGVLWNGQWIDR